MLTPVSTCYSDINPLILCVNQLPGFHIIKILVLNKLIISVSIFGSVRLFFCIFNLAIKSDTQLSKVKWYLEFKKFLIYFCG